MSKNILITGGAGYIGSTLIDKLLLNGNNVRVLDRLMFGKEPLREFIQNPHFELVEADVRDILTLRTAMEGIDQVVHLAAIVGYDACKKDLKETREVNIEATEAVVNFALVKDIKDIVFASTCSVYGFNTDGICTEETLPNPISEYGKTKLTAEQYVISRGGTALRFATAFGNSRRMRYDLLINDFVKQAATEEETTIKYPNSERPYIHVVDIACAIDFILSRQDIQGEIFNIADKDMNYTKQQIVDAIQTQIPEWIVKIDQSKTVGDKRNYAADGQKIAALGYRPSITLDKSIENMKDLLLSGKIDPDNPIYYND